MRTILTFVVLAFFSLSVSASAGANWTNDLNGNPELDNLPSEMLQLSVDDFLNLTPKKYKEMTGEKLGFKNTVKLKAAQKFIKKNMNEEAPDISKGLYILLAIIGWAWLAMGLMDDWSGSDWIVCLVLYALCYVPGLIFALVKMKNYY